MSRESAASLEVVRVLPGQRPAPPELLNEAEAQLWRDVCATRPLDWFTAETFPLLEEYVRVAVYAGTLAKTLQKYKGIPTGKSFKRYQDLRAMQDRNARSLLTLATKMRLTQQSRYDEKHAAGAARPGKKPWEVSG